MISQEFDYDHIRLNSELFSINQYKDSIYRGELHESTLKRHGQGVIVYDNGRVYEGTWQADKRDGRGFELYVNGHTYTGEYKNGKANVGREELPIHVDVDACTSSSSTVLVVV